MSDTAIYIKNLGKMHKLFKSPKDKVLEAFGVSKFFFWNRIRYQEFWALRNISLTLKKGERVGIIGRNGAGKSTLLKIITGNVAPTEGEVKVAGKVQALMELGTGFHPDFTGRQNIRASLSYQGLESKKIAELEDEIVEFAELGNFIEQPIKTYSAGMYARLAFSVATAVDPEILIIDEVLGAGDGYFASKCLEKMKKLTEESGATVLFVSHDLASVQLLCKKVVWIDRGGIRLEGDPLTVIKSYTAAIREQEEKRLRVKNLGINGDSIQDISDSNGSMLFHIINKDWRPFLGSHPIKKITLKVNDSVLDEIKVGGPMDNDKMNSAHIITDKGFIDWTEPMIMDCCYVRSIENLKGKYSHAAFVFPRPDWIEKIHNAFLEIEYKDVSEEQLFLECYDGKQYRRIGCFDNTNSGEWKIKSFELKDIVNSCFDSSTKDNGPEENCQYTNAKKVTFTPVVNNVEGDIYGTGEVVISKVSLLDGNDNEQYLFSSGGTFKIRIQYTAFKEILNPVFVAAIYRSDGLVINQAISSKNGIEFPSINEDGIVDIIYDPILLGSGEYVISTAIFHNVNFLSKMESPAYCLHDRKYHFKIVQPENICIDLGVVNHPVKWAQSHWSRN